MVFRERYILDFLGLTGHHVEKTWRMPFCENWKPLSWNWNGLRLRRPAEAVSIDYEDYYFDLLFYQRRLRCAERRVVDVEANQ